MCYNIIYSINIFFVLEKFITFGAAFKFVNSLLENIFFIPSVKGFHKIIYLYSHQY